MDKAHRDRVAFVRICSGRLDPRDEGAHTSAPARRSGSRTRRSSWRATGPSSRRPSPGDVVGVYDPGALEIGDTLTGGSRFVFEGIPSFAPEHFRRLVLVDPLRRKQFASGIEQLAQEGTVQLYRPPAGRAGDLVLGALGQLQFEVVKYRLEAEYGVEVRRRAGALPARAMGEPGRWEAARRR